MDAIRASLDPDRPAPTPWDTYSEWLRSEWSELLSSDPDELKVQRFLEQHPPLLPGGVGDIGPGGNHGPQWSGVFREPPLQGLPKNRRPDFMWITRSTSLITPICIEIERPGKKWFTQEGRPSRELTQALDQFVDWKLWFSEPENQLLFRRIYLQGEWEHRRLEPQFLLIYGRSSEFTESGGHKSPGQLRQKRDFMRRSDEFFITFDSLAPEPKQQNYATLTMTSDGAQLWAVPPSFTTGPRTMGLAASVRESTAAIDRTPLWTAQRKEYIKQRWTYWRKIALEKDNRAFRSAEVGE
jgi:hypothetical protein